MGLFKDSKFEELDWLSQITETIESELNTALARLPDRINLTYEDVMRYTGDSWRLNLEATSIVGDMLLKLDKESPTSLSWDERNTIFKCFSFEISDDLMLDLENCKLIGNISLVKNVSTFEDEALQKIMGASGLDDLRYIRYSSSPRRMNEILELLEYQGEALKGRSIRLKVKAIRERLRSIFKNNEWRIRDTALANKICLWIKRYSEDGNLAAFNNFCKVKVMTHNGGPIYSIEEQEI